MAAAGGWRGESGRDGREWGILDDVQLDELWSEIGLRGTGRLTLGPIAH